MSMRTCVTILLVIPVRSAQLTLTGNRLCASRIKGIAQEHSLVPDQDKQCMQCLWKIPSAIIHGAKRALVTCACVNKISSPPNAIISIGQLYAHEL